MKEKVLVLGTGGHCQSVLDALSSQNIYEPYLIDNCSEKVKYGLPVLGGDACLESLFKDGYRYAFVAVGSVGNPGLRVKLIIMLKNIGFEIPNIIDKSATIANNAQLGNGVFVGKGVIINSYCNIGSNCIINTGCIVEHGCEIGEFVHIAPGVTLCGKVIIGNNTHVGAGSTVIQDISIGENTLIGAGSVVTKNMGSGLLAYGNPCRVIK